VLVYLGRCNEHLTKITISICQKTARCLLYPRPLLHTVPEALNSAISENQHRVHNKRDLQVTLMMLAANFRHCTNWKAHMGYSRSKDITYYGTSCKIDWRA